MVTKRSDDPAGQLHTDIYAAVFDHFLRAGSRSPETLATVAGCNRSYVYAIGRGQRLPSQEMTFAFDRHMNAAGLLIEVRRLIDRLEACADRARTLGPEPPSTREEDMDATRRRLLEAMAALGVGAALPLGALETIRNALDEALPESDRSDHGVADWEETAWEYGHTYCTAPPNVLLSNLSTDVAALQQRIAGEHDERARRDLCRPGAQLATLMAMTVGNLGRIHEERRWWRTARNAADSSGDRDLRVWVRGHTAIRALYEHRPFPLIRRQVEETLEIAGGSASAGVMELLGAHAQALAMNRDVSGAEQALARMKDTQAALPDSATSGDSLYNSPEHDLHHTASFVYTRLGKISQAAKAQEEALALYPTSDRRQIAQVELHRASCLVQDGGITEGITHARSVVEGLPERQRTALVREVAEAVLHAVPSAERRRTTVREYRECLAPSPAAAT